MKSAKNFFLILATAPNLKTARKLAKAALEARLIACANLVPKIESHYWWQGKIEFGSEVLILMKTATLQVPKLEALMLSQHPYDTPEIIAVPLVAGTDRYLEWILASLGGPSKARGHSPKSKRARPES